ncbi:MAG: DNA replication and repair protein RecF [Chloroflexota bacterium]|nr:DNA replication and repair protein RecF [Chloroflexota bacterium]
MHLVELELEEFRSYRRLQLHLDRAGLRLVGDNASGKSSLLEAIAMLATTRSIRTSSERELIHWRSGEDFSLPPFSRIRGVVTRGDRTIDIEIAIQIEPGRTSHIKKLIRINGRPVRALDAVGSLNAVLFSPEDIELISGSPAGRRRYLDSTISQLDRSYLRSLARFSRILEQRNSLLKSLSGSGITAGSRQAGEQLDFWDAELVAHGSAVIARRLLIVNRLGRLAAERFELLSMTADLEVLYQSSVSLTPVQMTELVTMDRLQPVVARNFTTALNAARSDELRRGATLVGPHRDDVTFQLAGLDVSMHGSRGQQRLVVVALKLAISALMQEISGESPVLMLDDVLSELDPRHQASLLDATAAAGLQVIVTATEPSLLRRPILVRIPASRVAFGSILPLDNL